MKIFKHVLNDNVHYTKYDKYSWGLTITNGQEIDIVDVPCDAIYKMYLSGEITFLQCRRYLKRIDNEGKEVSDALRDEFKLRGNSRDIDALTRYYVKAKEERAIAYDRLLTYIRLLNEEIFFAIFENSQVRNAYVEFNDASHLISAVELSGGSIENINKIKEYIDEFLIN